MPKGPQGQKPKKLPKDPVSRAVSIMRQATKQAEVGDTADKITRAPKKKR